LGLTELNWENRFLGRGEDGSRRKKTGISITGVEGKDGGGEEKKS